jgi:hypothetical protein
MEDVGTSYDHLVYSTTICYILRPFDIFYGHLVYFPPVLVCCTKKNLATLSFFFEHQQPKQKKTARGKTKFGSSASNSMLMQNLNLLFQGVFAAAAIRVTQNRRHSEIRRLSANHYKLVN